MKGEVRKLQKGVAAAVIVVFLMVVTVSLSADVICSGCTVVEHTILGKWCNSPSCTDPTSPHHVTIRTRIYDVCHDGEVEVSRTLCSESTWGGCAAYVDGC